MAKKKFGTCEIRWCKRDGELVDVNENIGDGCFAVEICSDCAKILGIGKGQDLPADSETVRKKIKTARKLEKN